MLSGLRALSVLVVIGSCGGAPVPAPKSALDIYTASTPAMVTIETGTRAGRGFVVESDGLVVASLHTIQGNADIRVRLYNDPNEYPVTAIAGYDASRDLALLRIDAKRPLPTAALGDSSRVSVDQHVFALGSAGPFEGVITTVRSLGRGLTSVFTIRTANPDQWLGPLFNDRGEVVALAAVFLTTGERLVIAVPTNYLREMIEHKGSLPPATFAAHTADVPSF